MNRIIATLLLMSGIYSSSFAQVVSDALLFSERLQPVTARSAAVGGALGALGGDMSTLFNNPAGIAIYRSSEFTLSPGMQFTNIKTTFLADSTLPSSRNSRIGFNFGGAGLIFAPELGGGDWKNVNFGVAFSRVASFSRTLSFNGVSTGSRLINMVDNANASNVVPDNLNPFEEQMAWDAYLIDNPGGGTDYVAALTDSNYVRKSQIMRQSGGIHELALSLGGNYNHKFYIGGALGISFAKLRDIRDYTETEESGNIDFKSLQFNETRELKGTGVNLKLGFIYRATKNLRFGAAIHTPTIYSTTERYSTTLSGAVIWGDTLRVKPESDPYLSPTGQYKQNLLTPWLFNLSVGGIFGKRDSKTKGFIGVDADYLNYASSSFALKANDQNVTASDQVYIDNINRGIEDQYQGVLRLRAGAEIAMESFRIRAGYRLQTSPYQTTVSGINELRHDINFGVGIRQQHFFFDITYSHTLQDFEYTPYSATSENNNPRTSNELRGGLVLMTFGLRF